MDVQLIETIVASIGFPIVMCLLLFYYIQRLNEKHDSEIDKLTEAMNENTKILTQLSVMITSIQSVHEKTLKKLDG